MKKLIVFTGAGISAESGIKTFRDSDGLWEQYDISEVATPEAWHKNKALVLDFYNMRRKQVIEAIPNAAHASLASLEKHFEVHIITQNIDNLHERAGSSKVLHLHGEITKSRSTYNPQLIYDIKGWELKLGDKCEEGSQLRPHIVWFGESVPAMDEAAELVQKADLFAVIGTSLAVYPAAGLVHIASKQIPKFLVDPAELNTDRIENLTIIKGNACSGVPIMQKMLMELIKK